ncbi:MAG: hypothetical protein M1828_004979 [Chrysothrix sp. TS-e1954]|nr:MAG: hypothetical protein M1828_004979 [Chrysothrix sp. TS-e1954]
MEEIVALSPAQTILLATSLASESDISGLWNLVRLNQGLLVPELVLRILLSYLPETLEPSSYTSFLTELLSPKLSDLNPDAFIDCSSVSHLSKDEAHEALHKQRLLHLRPSGTNIRSLRDAPDDIVVQFLIHRAHRIDIETGAQTLLPSLLTPFLDISIYLRTWFLSTVLPLLRFDYEYHNDATRRSLASFEVLNGADGIELLMSKSQNESMEHRATPESLGRDVRGIIGPWTYGNSQRKRRKLDLDAVDEDLPHNREQDLVAKDGDRVTCQVEGCNEVLTNTSQWRKHARKVHAEFISNVAQGVSKGKLHVGKATDDLDPENGDCDWRLFFQWLVTTAVNDFALVAGIIENWDGPHDVDFGGYLPELTNGPKDSAEGLELRRQYCQTAFASIYATDSHTADTIEGAHGILVRLAELLDFEPPPGLATSIDLLPRIERHADLLNDLPATLCQLDALLRPDQPLTRPKLETFSLLQILVYSAYQLRSLGCDMSIMKAAKLRFYSDESEQLGVARNILAGVASGKPTDDQQWVYVRDRLLWLWSWGIPKTAETPTHSHGILGRISRKTLEIEILKALCRANQLSVVARLYVEAQPTEQILQLSEVEHVLTEIAHDFYDTASNGNRTRGNMKKAASLVASFSSRFPESESLRGLASLIAATHALSFYALTLQPGQPLLPASIRKVDDPLLLITKTLDQNPRSYTKLDDLISIGQNLTLAMQAPSNSLSITSQVSNDKATKFLAERRVIGMAVEAALNEDDFETAYSYVINRLTPPAPDDGTNKVVNDDVSWRAAWQAGKYRSIHAPKAATRETPQVRRLEQRMELLSQALLLAPPAALSEVLAAWRRCEEELLTLLVQEADEERAFDEKFAGNTDIEVPGGFGGTQPAYSVQARRKEVGRGATEEAPMGLFDVARGAAVALGRTAGGAFADKRQASRSSNADVAAEFYEETSPRTSEERVRKRDMVANAVTGGLASGIGWVLGANPAATGHER